MTTRSQHLVLRHCRIPLYLMKYWLLKPCKKNLFQITGERVSRFAINALLCFPERIALDSCEQLFINENGNEHIRLLITVLNGMTVVRKLTMPCFAVQCTHDLLNNNFS
jgi:hypothetical protein